MPDRSCPVCHSTSNNRILDRSTSPALQNAVYADAETARQSGICPLEIRACDRCGFVWNAAFNPELIDYADNYDNAQGYSDVFKAHLRDRIDRIVSSAPAGKLEILEVGCGQGDFLADLTAAFGQERITRAVGFDPACRDDKRSDKIEIFKEYFNADTARKNLISPDIIVSRHTIEHVPGPVKFLKDIRRALPEGNSAKIYLETPTNDWIIRNGVMHDFFYEHCSLFTLGSIAIAFEQAGFVPEVTSTCFDGQYLWAEGQSAEPLNRPDFRALETDYVKTWTERASKYRADGPVYIWGAGAKGVTFATIIDPEKTLFSGLVDINPAKQGHFIGGTGHPVVSVDDLVNAKPAAVFVMNPNYETEIRTSLDERGLTPDIILVH